MITPPHLNLSPETAAAELSDSLKVSDLSGLAGSCSPASDTPAGGETRGQDRKRLFSVWEITRYLIPVDPVHFRRVLRQNPDLPQGTSQGGAGAKWFTMAEVLALKTFFHATGTRRKTYLPYRPEALPPRIAALANTRSGSGKTTACAHLAVAAAMDGYRVLALDLDSRAGLTRLLGAAPRGEWQTAMSLVARHYGAHLRVLNRLRVERGEAPVAVEETLARAAAARLEDLVVATRWPNLDLICADDALSAADLRIAGWRQQARNWKFWQALAAGLAQDAVSGRYDLVLLDTPSDLGHLSLAGQIAARILLVPFRGTAGGSAAVSRYLALLAGTLSALEETENIAARALGTDETAFGWDALRAVMTCCAPDQPGGVPDDIRLGLGSCLLPDRQNHTPLITPDRTVYDADYRETNRETYVRAREGFDLTYAAFKSLMLGSWYREEQAARNLAV